MTKPPQSSTLGPPPLSDLTDDTPIVLHGPVQGSVGIAAAKNAASEIHLVTADVEAAVETPPTPIAAAQPKEPTRAALAESGPVRALSLDALRGVFLIVMTLGFTIHGSHYADWMYHRQFPPPGRLVDVPGITWRDLAYAAFIFTLAAALPITLSRRIEKGATEVAITLGVIRRFVLLFVFALLIGHSNTFFTGYTQEARIVALVGFVIMFLAFMRRPPSWSDTSYKVVNRLAWVAAIGFLLLSPQVYDSTFIPERRDDIIAGLAFAALAGSIVWYLTRNSVNTRLAVLAATVALYLGSRSGGWVQDWWWSSPVPWLIRPSNLSLLTVVIPGTIAGDALLRWIRSGRSNPATGRWTAARLTSLAFLCAAMTPVVVVGLYNRWVLLTTQVIVALCIAGALLTHRPASDSERLVRQLFLWASLWLLLGLFLEPAEGGIRKVPETLSYFFTVTGVTTMLLVSCVIVVDMFGVRSWTRPLIDVGHNPMIAYVMYTVFLNSLLELIPDLRGVLRATPGEAMLRSVLLVVIVVVIVQAFTRRRIYWRT